MAKLYACAGIEFLGGCRKKVKSANTQCSGCKRQTRSLTRVRRRRNG